MADREQGSEGFDLSVLQLDVAALSQSSDKVCAPLQTFSLTILRVASRSLKVVLDGRMAVALPASVPALFLPCCHKRTAR